MRYMDLPKTDSGTEGTGRSASPISLPGFHWQGPPQTGGRARGVQGAWQPFFLSLDDAIPLYGELVVPTVHCTRGSRRTGSGWLPALFETLSMPVRTLPRRQRAPVRSQQKRYAACEGHVKTRADVVMRTPAHMLMARSYPHSCA